MSLIDNLKIRSGVRKYFLQAKEVQNLPILIAPVFSEENRKSSTEKEIRTNKVLKLSKVVFHKIYI